MSGLIFKPYNAMYIPTPANLNYLAPHEPLKVSANEKEFVLNPDYPGKYDIRRNDLHMKYGEAGKPLYLSGPDRVVYASSADMILCKPNYVASTLEVLKRVDVPSPYRFGFDRDVTCCNVFAVDEKHILVVSVSSGENGNLWDTQEGKTYVTFRVAKVTENDIEFTDVAWFSRSWSVTRGGSPYSPGSYYVASNDDLFFTEAAHVVSWDDESDNKVVYSATKAVDGYVHVSFRYTQYPLPSDIGTWKTRTIQDGSCWVYTVHIDENSNITGPSGFYSRATMQSLPAIGYTGQRDVEGNPEFLLLAPSKRPSFGDHERNPPYRSYLYKYTISSGRLSYVNRVTVPLEYNDYADEIEFFARLQSGDMRFLVESNTYVNGDYGYSRYEFLDVNPDTLEMNFHSRTERSFFQYGDRNFSFHRTIDGYPNKVFEVLDETSFIGFVSSGGPYIVPELVGDEEGEHYAGIRTPSSMHDGIVAVGMDSDGFHLKSDVKNTLLRFWPLYKGTSAERLPFNLDGRPPFEELYNQNILMMSRLKDGYYLQSGQSGMFRIVKREDVFVRGAGTTVFPRFPNPNANSPVITAVEGTTEILSGDLETITLKGVRFLEDSTIRVGNVVVDHTLVGSGEVNFSTLRLPPGTHSIFVSNDGSSWYEYPNAITIRHAERTSSVSWRQGASVIDSDGRIDYWDSEPASTYRGPHDVPTSTGHVLVSFTGALTYSGYVRTWDGYSQYWQEKQWDNEIHDAIENAPSGSGYKSLAMNFSSYAAVNANDELEEWGFFADDHTPPNLPGPFSMVAGGLYAAGLRKNGTVCAWSGSSGTVFTEDAFPDENIVYVAAGSNYVYGLTSDGRMLGWEKDSKDEYSLISGIPQRSDIVKIFAGGKNAAVIFEDGTCDIWGADRDNNVLNTDVLSQPDIVSIGLGTTTGIAINKNDKVWTWGDADFVANAPSYV